MKLNIISDNAGWVYDAITKDYAKYTRHEMTHNNPDVTWCLNFWALGGVQKQKNLVAHVHHVNRQQLGIYNFGLLDAAKLCLVPNRFTEDFLKVQTSIPIVRKSYWLLSARMGQAKSKRHEILDHSDQILIGSFQKDSESRTGKPKMVKGPDVFIDVVRQIDNAKVVLTGYDRQYVIRELEKAGIPYVYYPMVKDLNPFYDALDWYLVTSREEGGPQAVLEASYRRVRLLSTTVGIAPDVVHKDCLCNTSDDFVEKIREGIDRTEYNYSSVINYVPEKMVKEYDDLFEEVASGKYN